MSEQDKIAFAAKKGVNYKELPREAVKNQGDKWQWRQGLGLRKGFRQSVGQRWKGLREEGLERDGRQRLELGRRVGLERDPSAHRRARSEGLSGGMSCPGAFHWNPIPAQNRFSVFRRRTGNGENLEPSGSKCKTSSF